MRFITIPENRICGRLFEALIYYRSKINTAMSNILRKLQLKDVALYESYWDQGRLSPSVNKLEVARGEYKCRHRYDSIHTKIFV